MSDHQCSLGIFTRNFIIPQKEYPTRSAIQHRDVHYAVNCRYEKTQNCVDCKSCLSGYIAVFHISKNQLYSSTKGHSSSQKAPIFFSQGSDPNPKGCLLRSSDPYSDGKGIPLVITLPTMPLKIFQTSPKLSRITSTDRSFNCRPYI